MSNGDRKNGIPQVTDFEPGALINGRYRVIRLLGHGGMGAAYLVADEAKDGVEIVLKVLQPSTIESAAQDTLRQEFSILARLQHPNLVRVYDYGKIEKAGHFFTMEFVNGDSLRTVAQRLSIDELTELAAQILRALEYVHSSGLIHGDIKDQNILVTQNEQGLRVKLMDFGLAEQTKTTTDVNVGGTLEYMAPERLRGGPPTPEVDLYAFGVLMYECLSGTFPFTGSANEITQGHLNRIPTRLLQLNPEIPEIWDVIVARLLAKAPGDRFHSCHDVQADLERYSNLRVFDHGLLSARIWDIYLATKNSEVDTVVHAILQAVGKKWVKKEEEVTRFHALYGDEGSGKNRIMDQIKNHLQVEDIDVFEASCNSTLESPYQPILNAFSTHKLLFDNLSKLVSREKLESSPTSTLDKNNKTVVRYERDPELMQYRLREAISGKISEVAKKTPIILILRDIEYADESTLELVFFLCRVLEQERFAILISVNLNRASEYTQRIFENQKKAIGKTLELSFAPLSSQEIESLLNSALQEPQMPEGFFEELHQHSGGNLLAIVEIITDLARKGALSRIQDTWTLSQDFDLRSVVPVGLKELLRSTISSLSERERTVTRILSVYGSPMEESRLAAILSMEMHDLDTVLQGLLRNRIFDRRIISEDVTYDFAIRSLRDEIYNSIPPNKREELHRILAYDLLSQYKQGAAVSMEQLAFHFLSGKEIDKSISYASQAISHLRRVHSNVQALRLCELADTTLNLETFRHRRPFLHKKAEIEALLGENDKALKSFEQLMPMYHQGRAQSLLLRKIGELQQKLGDVQKAMDSYNSALLQLPKTDRVGEALIYKELVWTYTHLGDYQTAIDNANKGLSKLDRNQPSQPLAFLFNNLAIACFYNGQMNKAIEFFTKSAEIKKAIGDERGFASTLNNLGAIQNMIGQSEDALTQWNESLEIRERIGDIVGLAETLNNMAIAFMEKGSYSRSWNLYHRSYELMKRIGDVKGMIYSLCNIGELEYLREDFSASISTLEKGLEYAQRVEARNDETELLYQLGRVFLALNQLDEATQKVDQCIRLADDLGQKLRLGRYTHLKSQIYRESKDLANAQLWLDKAKKYAEEVSEEALEIEIELEATRLIIDYNQAEKVPKLIKDIIVRAEKGGYKTAHIRGLTILAESGLAGKSPLKEVESSLLNAKQLAESMNLSLELKRILHLYGQVYMRQGDVRIAYDSYKDAYQHLKSLVTSITKKDHQSSFLAKAENIKLLKDIQELQTLLKSRHSS